MGAFVADAITFNTTAGVKTVSITPAVGELLVAIYGLSSTSSIPSVTDDQGGTYTDISQANNTANTRQVGCAIRTAPVASAVSHTLTMTPSGDNGGGVAVLRFSGIPRFGSDAVRKFSNASLGGATTPNVQNGSSGASGAPSVTLLTSALTVNPVITAFIDQTNPPGVTAPTSFTRRRDVGYITPTTGLDYATIDSGFTTSAVTWGSSSATAWGIFALELDTSGGLPVEPRRVIRNSLLRR